MKKLITTLSPAMTSPAGYLFGGSLAAMALYFLVMAVFWAGGLESIYAHPTPFYGLWKPVGMAALTWGWLPFALGIAGYGALRFFGLLDGYSGKKSGRLHIGWVLFGSFLFLAAFAAGTAMIRGGLHGIEQAYQRETYEYIGDIGKTSSIQSLFSRYLEIRPYLSMHAKVHPPGPIALLWLFSYGVGKEAMTLSIVTILFSALAVFPLWGWLRILYDDATALAGVWLYALVPSVVLFTATSADALFTPFTLFTLFAFDKALREDKAVWALPAGLGYGIMTMLKFSLAGVGIWFALSGLLLLRRPETRSRVVRTAFLMGMAALAVHGAIWWWTGFNWWAAFEAGKAQFDTDQFNLDLYTPRYPGWTFRLFFNPMTWFYFAGIPVSLIFLRRLGIALPWIRRRTPPDDVNTPSEVDLLFGPSSPPKSVASAVITPAATAWMAFFAVLTLNFLYLARGEGERSALYLFPFLIAPVAEWLTGRCRRDRSAAPLLAVLIFLILQCVVTEVFFYTYW